MAKSTLPVEHGYTNAFYDRAGFLIDHGERFAAVALKIQELNREGMSLEDIMAYVQKHLRPELRELYTEYQDVPDTPPVLAAPPRAVEVYGRFADRTSVVDIGSGNCNKLIKYTGSLKILCVDPEFQRDCNVVKGVAGLIQDQHDLFREDVIFTSFMAMCQLETSIQNRVYAHDGLHLLPNHPLLLETGVAARDKDTIVVNAPNRVYTDHFVECLGYEVKPGYLLRPTFLERSIEINLGTAAKTNYSPLIDARPCRFSDVNLSDVTFKMDGIAYELEISNTRATLVDRAGSERVGVCNFKHHLCLHVEELGSCFTLIRIVMYRGMVPPHCGNVLADFVDRVRIVINGKPLCAPPPVVAWQDGPVPVFGPSVNGIRATYLEPSDGIITRFEERDHYTKFQWTADLLNTNFPAVRLALVDKGLTVSVDIRMGLWEYGINRIRDEVIFSPIRLRVDKTTPTAISTVAFLVEQPTLPEKFVLENL